jgi:protein TonB
MKPLFFLSLLLLTLHAGAQDSSANDIAIDTAGKSSTSINIPAAFPGGSEAWKKFLEKRLHSGVALDHGAPRGRYTVTVSYKIDTTGKLTEIEILQDPGYGTIIDVISALKKSPLWIPATMNGRKVFYRQKQNFDYYVD